MSEQAIKTLRKAVNRPKIEEGTVVRLQVNFEMAPRDYLYSALFTNGKWYSTSQRNSELQTGAVIKAVMNQAEFEQVLQSPQVSHVAVAAEWVEL